MALVKWQLGVKFSLIQHQAGTTSEYSPENKTIFTKFNLKTSLKLFNIPSKIPIGDNNSYYSKLVLIFQNQNFENVIFSKKYDRYKFL